jgi:hypothetical protein
MTLHLHLLLECFNPRFPVLLELDRGRLPHGPQFHLNLQVGYEPVVGDVGRSVHGVVEANFSFFANYHIIKFDPFNISDRSTIFK